MKTKIFADGANLDEILSLNDDPSIEGFTTNPTLMRKAGVNDYEEFSRDLSSQIKDKPISFEVFSDAFEEMEYQALKLSKLGDNIFVKIPITNSVGNSALPLINKLSKLGVKLNVTAIMTREDAIDAADSIDPNSEAYLSIFAGRIADTGIDPVPIMMDILSYVSAKKNISVIWASPREILNLAQALNIGCHVITMTSDLLNKRKLIGKSLKEYSLETVKMFHNDAIASNFKIS
jgi:transaldolase